LISGKTELYILIGGKTKHSLSPVIQNAALEKLGINAKYLCCEIKEQDVGKAIAGIRALNIAGINVTVPYKVKVMEFLDGLSQEAKDIGAVNTILVKDGKLTGYNTDGLGAIGALEEKTSLEGKIVTLVGAGGAARAISFELAKKVKKIFILDIDEKKAKDLAESLKGAEATGYESNRENLQNSIQASQILINASPIGMAPNEGKSAVPKDLLFPELLVFDIVYVPVNTQLIKDAQEKGCKTITGDRMLVLQGAVSFELWTGEKAPVELMQKVVTDNLEVR